MRFRQWFFPGAIALLLLLRLLHFGAAIDAPHDWRQCDTAHYIRDFYQNGIDPLHPAVCWMGARDTLALEFPLPEAAVAVVWQVSGESIPVARLVFLAFFAGALFYFYKIAERLFGRPIAEWATLVYLALPLSIFYSRAVHIDFSVQLLAHAMVYYFLRAVDERSWRWMAVSGAAATLAFTIKAPYAFYFFLPMGYYAFRQKATGWTFRAGLFYLPALLAFYLWQQHVNTINSASPDLSYILHFRKMTQAAHWYFGTWQQRLSLYPWWILLQRGVLEVAGPGGIVFFLLGCLRLRQVSNWPFLLLWIAGLAAYVLIFFNLNFVHNYYQIPLLAPLAVLTATGLQAFSARNPRLPYVFFGVLVAANVAYTERIYYKIPADQVEIARLIRENTPDSALVVVTYGNMDCRDPRILFRARRRGWSVEEAALKPAVIGRLRSEQGARYWAYTGAELPRLKMNTYLDALPAPRVFQLGSIPGRLFLFDLPEGE